MSGFNEISPKTLMRLIGTDGCPVIVDVRIEEDIAEIPFAVPSSFRHRYEDLDNLEDRLRGRSAVIICHKGKKLSAGTAAWLRAKGIHAEVLEGGAVAWEAASLPAIPISTLDQITSRWVTRHRPKIDRIACPWLIRRFVDPEAEFLFVPPTEVNDVAARFGAIAFDMPEGDWTHEGDKCSFDMMIRKFGLSHPALDRLAIVVRAADTNQHALAPQAAGLLAISAGLSRLKKDDNAQMQAGFLIYDALYRWARDAFDEGHGPHPSGDQ